jgi:polyhydroxybutyrate depolymerase
VTARRRWLSGAAASCVLAVAACSVDSILGASAAFKPGTSQHSLIVGPLTRTYVLHVPAHRPTTTAGTLRSYPLVVVLHGSSATGADIEATSQMDTLSELNGFVAVYPDGSQGAGGLFPTDWNAGQCCGEAQRENIDDIGFISAVIAQVSASLPIDSHRVYVAGFSDGGRMAYYLACQIAPAIAAIAVVSGSLEDDNCLPNDAVPLVGFHGTDDDEVPYDEPALTAPPGPVADVAADLPPSVQFWVAANGCSTATVGNPSIAAPDIVETNFSACTTAPVIFYDIEGGTHAWPGEPIPGPGSQPPMSEVNASAIMVSFFNRQVRH